MKQIYIVGAGGFGREVFDWMMETLDLFEEYSFAGFLDDNLQALDGVPIQASVVSKISDYKIGENDYLICGIGDPSLKKEICQSLVEKGGKFISLIHPSARLGRGSKIGNGSVVCPNVVITCDVEVGDFVVINLSTTLGHDSKVGNWSTLSAHCDVTGFVEVGESVFMGSGARIIPSKTLGEASVIGAGSVVIRDVASGTSVFGNPARTIF